MRYYVSPPKHFFRMTRTCFMNLLRNLLFVVCLASPLLGQQATIQRHLLEHMTAATSEPLPVSFQMTDRLRYADFQELIRGLPRQPRRRLVVDALQAHMEASQGCLHERLRACEERGSAEILHRNWLGNFIYARATASAIIEIVATVPGLHVRAVTAFDRKRVMDRSLTWSRTRPAGDGPSDVGADRVWTQGITGAGIVWANADAGVRASQRVPSDVHPGLAGRLWTNPGEIAANGIDEDGNGYVDDLYGWSFSSFSNFIDDQGGHGTQTAGAFIARDPVSGTEYGISPGTRIMTVALGPEITHFIAMQYAVLMGADGITSSFSWKNDFVPPPDYAMHRDVAEMTLAAGVIRTNSTSNNGAQCNDPASLVRIPFNIGAPGCVPAPWLGPDQRPGRVGGVLGVGAYEVGTGGPGGPTLPSYTPCGPFAWNLNDLLAVLPTFPTSQWDSVNDDDYPRNGGREPGLIKPDIVGPSGFTTAFGVSSFGDFHGTSAATPAVAACLALALSANRSLLPEDLAMALQVSAHDFGMPGKDNRSGAGKVDAWELVKLARAVHRVQDQITQDVDVSVSAGHVTFELDGLANTPLLLVLGHGAAHRRHGEFIQRVQTPIATVFGRTNAQGDFRVRFPLHPSHAGMSTRSQFLLLDPAFGPLTGSNAITLRILP